MVETDGLAGLGAVFANREIADVGGTGATVASGLL